MQLGIAKFEMRFGFFYLSLFILRLFTYCPSILSSFINDITIDDEETTFVADDQDLKGDDYTLHSALKCTIHPNRNPKIPLPSQQTERLVQLTV